MVVFFGIAAASLLALPVPQTSKLEPDFKADFNEGGGGALQVRVVVSPDGVPIQCDESFLNGPKTNVAAFCSMLESRTRFSPARDEAGHPSYGVIYVWSHWSNRRWVGNNVPTWDPPNLVLPVNKMPKGFPDAALFRLIMQVGPNGLAGGDCTVMAAHKISEQASALLCHEAAADPITAVTDEHGNPVPSVQEYIVRLVSERFTKNVEKLLRQLNRK